MKIKKTKKGYKADVTEAWEWAAIALGLACMCAYFAFKIGGYL